MAIAPGVSGSGFGSDGKPASPPPNVARMTDPIDPERDRLTARIGRVAKVGANMTGAVGARVMGKDQKALAAALRAALGRSKGPLMKVAQLLATIPDLLPEAYAEEFRKLQAHAPPMGWPFVQRRMRSELGE